MKAAQFFEGYSLIKADHTSCSSAHVLQRIDDNTVVGTMTSSLYHDETPKTYLVNKDFFLFLPCSGERLVFRLRRQRETIKRTDHMHVGIDRAFRHRERQWKRVGILLDVWLRTHLRNIAQIIPPRQRPVRRPPPILAGTKLPHSAGSTLLCSTSAITEETQ